MEHNCHLWHHFHLSCGYLAARKLERQSNVSDFNHKAIGRHAIAGCDVLSQRLTDYGPIEKLGNYINPNKSIPKEVVAIRNEFLKVQFQKLNGRIDHSENFCEWLDSISWTDEGKENVIFSHIQTEQRQQLIDDCLVSSL